MAQENQQVDITGANVCEMDGDALLRQERRERRASSALQQSRLSVCGQHPVLAQAWHRKQRIHG